MKMLTNLLIKVGKIKRDEKKNHTLFYLEKRREDDVGKKQGKAAFQKKQICTLENLK